MKRFSEQFNTKAQAVKMTAAERRALRERVVSYMEYHPLSKAPVPTPYQGELFLPVFLRSKTWRAAQFVVPALFVLVIGLSSWAEQAVPGDALYAVKQVNEDLRSTMVRGSYEKVVWETELLNRRMAEARILASEGRLTEEVEVEVAKAVQEHTENARKEIESLKEIDEDEATLAAIELTTALVVQSTALQNQGTKEGDLTSTDLLSEVVQVATEAVEQVTEDNNLPAYDRLMAKVESETTRARELLLSITDTATPEERGDVERRLTDIDVKISAAEAEMAVDEIKAREGLVAVLEQTHKLIVFMTNIDVRETVTVEEVVPVTLTEVERVEKVIVDIAEAERLLSVIEVTLNATSTPLQEEATKEKVVTATGLVRMAIAQATEALASDPKDVLGAEGGALEAVNLATDAARLLGIEPVLLVGEVPAEVVPATGGVELEVAPTPETEEVSSEEVATTTSEEAPSIEEISL